MSESGISYHVMTCLLSVYVKCSLVWHKVLQLMQGTRQDGPDDRVVAMQTQNETLAIRVKVERE